MKANFFLKDLTPMEKGGKEGNDRVAFLESVSVHLNPSHTGRLFHCYMLGGYICHFRGVGSILSL